MFRSIRHPQGYNVEQYERYERPSHTLLAIRGKITEENMKYKMPRCNLKNTEENTKYKMPRCN